MRFHTWFLALAWPLTAQSLLVTSQDLTYLQAEVAANSPRWQALKVDCDKYYVRPVRNLAPNLLDSNYSEINSNGPFFYGIVPIQGTYEASDLNNTITVLGACYLATIGNPGFADQARAAAYGAKAKDILMTVSRPTAWMKRSLGTASIVVNNGTATVTGLAHGQIGNADNYFLAQITGTGNSVLDTRQRAVGITATSWSFPTTAPNGTYTPTDISFLISTDGESGAGGIGHKFTIEQVAKGATTTVSVSSGSAFRIGQRVRIWGLPAPYDVLNGTWTAGAGTTTRAIKVPVDTSGLTTTANLMIGSYAAAIEEANAVSYVTAGTTTKLTTTGSFTVGDNVRVWGLASPYDGLNGTYTAAAGTSGTTLVIPYDSSSLSSGSVPSNTAYAGDLTRLRLTAQTLSGIHVGDTFTVSGVRGCTIANGTWKIAATTRPLTIMYPDGRPAPPLEGECSYDAPRQSNDAGYHFRELLSLLAFGYSWLNPLLSPAEKQVVVDKVAESAWIVGDNTIYPNLTHPMNNYYTATLSGLLLADVSMGAQLPAVVRDWIKDRTVYMGSFFSRWVAHGGYPQGLRDYGFSELSRIYIAALAEAKNGVDLRAAPYNFTWLDATLDYVIGASTPDTTQVDDWGVVAQLGGTPTSQDVRISAFATLPMAAWANTVGHPRAAQFSKFHHDALARVQEAAATIPPAYSGDRQAAVRSNPWRDLLLERTWTESDWTPSDLTYYAFTGDYAISRTAWNDPNAAYLTLQGNVFVDTVGQGKQKMKLGEVTIRRGGMKRLVGTADGFVARISDSPPVSDLHAMNAYSGSALMKYNRYYNGFWASPDTVGGSQYYNNWCVAGTNPEVMDRAKIPSYNANVVSMPAGSQPQISVKADKSSYSYWKVQNLGCYYTLGYRYAADAHNHVRSWTREVVFLRPSGMAVVRDSTQVINGTEDRFINWVVPKGGSVADAPGGKRFTVSNAQLGGDIGAITFLMPAGLDVKQLDGVKSDQVTSFNAFDRLEVRPAANGHTADTFVAVLDPSGDLSALQGAALLASTNGTALEIGTDTLVAFAGETLPMTYTLATIDQRNHVITGLTPARTYRVITGSSIVTITDTGTAGQSLVADSAGTISFQFGLDPAQPRIFITALPEARENTAYSASLTAVNGTSPYQWSILSGALPSGLSLQANGTIGGTPAQAGLFSFRVQVQDAASNTAQADLTLNVQEPAQTMLITTSFLAEARENQDYEQLISVSGGALPLQWSVPSGAECLGRLGLSLDQTGRIHGKPQASGVCELTIRVTDSSQFSAGQQYQLLVQGVKPLITATAMAGNSEAVVTFGYLGLPREQSCQVNAVNGAAIAASAVSGSGSSRRTVLLSGLQPDTEYRAAAYCGGAGLARSLAFRTQPAQTGTSSITIHLAPPARVGAQTAVIQYGLHELTSSIQANCPAKCKVVLGGLSRGALYQYRWQWTGGAAAPPASVRYFVAP